VLSESSEVGNSVGGTLGLTVIALDLQELHAMGHASFTIILELHLIQLTLADAREISAQLKFCEFSMKVKVSLSLQHTPHVTGQFVATSVIPHMLTRRVSVLLSNQRHDLLPLYLKLELLRQSKKSFIGFVVGSLVGGVDGEDVGAPVGFSVGASVGEGVGISVGVWDLVGLGVGG